MHQSQHHERCRQFILSVGKKILSQNLTFRFPLDILPTIVSSMKNLRNSTLLFFFLLLPRIIVPTYTRSIDRSIDLRPAMNHSHHFSKLRSMRKPLSRLQRNHELSQCSSWNFEVKRERVLLVSWRFWRGRIKTDRGDATRQIRDEKKTREVRSCHWIAF